MKKIITIALVVMLTVCAVFASADRKWSVGASFGAASMNEVSFNTDAVKVKNGTVGVGVDFRVDYELVEDVYLTGVVGWQLPDRNFIVPSTEVLAETPEGKQNYLTCFIGASLGHMKTDGENTNDTTLTDLVWYGTVGPEIVVNLNKGKVGAGVGAILKGSYTVAENVTLDMSANVALFGIKDSPFDDKVHLFTDYSIKLGATCKLK